MRIVLWVALSVLFLPGGLWAAPETAPMARVTAHDLTVRFDPPRHRLLAHDVLTVVGGPKATALLLHLAPTLKLASMTLDGSMLEAARTPDGTLRIPVPAGGTHKLALTYSGVIYDAVTRADDDNTRGVIGERGIYLSNESGWVPLPTTRTPARFAVKTIIPDPYLVVTQGGPATRTTHTTGGFHPEGDGVKPTDQSDGAGGTVTWNLAAHPATIPTDGLSLSAGPYVQKSRDVEGVKISTFFYKRHDLHADVWLDAAADMVRRYVKLIGEDPNGKFDIVENFFPAGYGMPAYALLGDQVIERHGGKIPRGYLDQEYVQCWFGNGLLVDDSTGNWSEALTTYFSNHLARERESQSEARAYRRGVLEKLAIRVKGEADFPLREFVEKTQDADNDVGRGKGAMFFHMLRERVGDKVFFDGVRSFTEKHMGSIVTWDRWLEAFDQDGAATALRPFLERAGVPEVGITLRKVRTIADSGAQVIAEVTATDATGAPWQTTVPVRVTYRDAAGSTRVLDTQVSIQDGPALLDVVVAGSPTAVEVDPDFDMLRRIAPQDLPHCLNRTLESDGERILVVDASEGLDAAEGLLESLADRIVRDEGFARRPTYYDWRSHKGPVVLLSVFPVKPQNGIEIDGEHFNDPTVSVLHSYGTELGPRTEYIALSPDAARRAGDMTEHGWDSWVTFRSGIPQDRRTTRSTPKTRIEIQNEKAAAERADQWVRALSATPRAPGQRKDLLVEQLEQALAGLEPVPLDGTFDLALANRADKAALHYVMGSHQGTLEGPYVRALCFSGSGTTRWLPHRTLLPIRWDASQSTPARLFPRLSRFNNGQGALVLVDKASWDALAPWLDGHDDLTEASKAELARPGRDGKPRPRPGSLDAWMAGRRARGHLPSRKPLRFPVLCVREDVLPHKASNENGPLGAIEELSIEIANTVSMTRAKNLLAWKPSANQARAPGVKPPVVVLMAHYDVVPWRDGVKYPGADDNASGVACLLEVARHLAKAPGAAHVGVVLALTDAAAWGLHGGRALQKQLATQFDVRAVINVDSIGRAISKPCHVIGHATHPALAKRVGTALGSEGIELGADIDRYAFEHGGDHYPFHLAGVPAVSLWASDQAVMDTVHDVPENVEANGIARIARALTTLVQGDLSWVLAMK